MKLIIRSILVIICSGLFFYGCKSAPKNFVQKEDSVQHQSSGIVLPSKTNNWQQIGEISENLTPEIVAAISYQYISDSKDFRPIATVYILKNKTTANVKLIENKIITGFIGSKYIKTENPKLKSKNKVSIKLYNHTVDLKNTYTHISVNKEIKAQSLFAQNAKKMQLVFYLTINREAPEEKKAALQFIDEILMRNL